jgi:hypothetical protein
MLNPRELRIGNIIDLGIVAGIYPSTEDIYNIWLHNGLSFSSDQISGELINEEWLVNFGFRKQELAGCAPSYWIPDNEHTFELDWDKASGLDLIHDGSTIGFGFKHIKYVHQLQNLYFALTGEELKLKQEVK